MKTSDQRNTTYSAAITSATGALYLREINALLPLIQSDNWKELLKQEMFENKLLLVNAETSRRKVIRHISSRIQYAFPEFWEIYASSKQDEQALMLFNLALNSVAVLYDFHFDVTIPAWKGSSRLFDAYSYQMKLDKLGDQFEEVDKWYATSRIQIIKIYKRTLKDAGFLRGDDLIQPRMKDEFFFPFLKNQQLWFLEACFLSQTDSDRITNLYAHSI